MTRVVFDEGHGETWTTDLTLASSLAPNQPEYHYFGHLADILHDIIGAKVETRTSTWEGGLHGVDVLVVAHPSDRSVEKGCAGSPVFNEHEIEAAVDFVRRGGGLFVLTEWDNGRWKNNLNDLLVQFGLSFGDDTLRASRADRKNSHLLSRHFVCSDFDSHAVTKDVTSITFHRGCSVSAGPGARIVIRAPAGQGVAGVSEFGKGRVVAVGDSDLFSIPFIGHADNARLLRNIVTWLDCARRDSAEDLLPIAQSTRGRVYNLRPGRHDADLKSVPGPWAIDAGPFRRELERLSYAPLPDPYTETETFIHEATLRFHELPRELRSAIVNFKARGNEHGIFLIRNLPGDKVLPATPADSRRAPNKRSYVSEFWVALMGSALGDLMAYSQEKDGEIFQNLCPTRKNESMLSSESSKILLDFHTETAFHPFMPDFLLLHCLRADHEKVARTIAASTRHIIQRLPLRTRAILFEDLYRTGIDFSFGSQSGVQANGPVLPVLYGNPYDPFMKYDLDLMKGLTPEAEEALNQVRIAANACKDYVKLEPGDFLVVDNRRAIHGRSEFTARYDGMDRWLQRAYVARDLALAEEERRRGERVLETQRILETEFQV